MNVELKNKNRWFCKSHGLEGGVGDSWCFGCYSLDENEELPVPYIGYKTPRQKMKRVIIRYEGDRTDKMDNYFVKVMKKMGYELVGSGYLFKEEIRDMEFKLGGG